MATRSRSVCETIFASCGDKRSKVDSKKYPYCCVASMLFEFEKRNGEKKLGRGTGYLVLVKKKYIIITAAHSIVHKDSIPLKRVEISLGRDGELNPFGLICKQKEHVWVHPKYQRNVVPSTFDIACILLNKVEDLVKKQFNPNYYFRLRKYDFSLDMKMSGYPGSVKSSETWRKKTQWEADLECERRGELLYYKNATTKGNSGSPVFTEIDGQCYVMAMHIGCDENWNQGLVLNVKKREALQHAWKADPNCDTDGDFYSERSNAESEMDQETETDMIESLDSRTKQLQIRLKQILIYLYGSLDSETDKYMDGSLDSETDKDMDGSSDSETDKDMDGSSDSETDKDIDGSSDSETDKDMDGSSDSETDKDMDGSSDSETDKDMDGSSDSETDKDMDG